MSLSLLHGLAAFLFFAGASATPSLAAEPTALMGYNADIKETSVSGISSGAFMAVQFGTAWSSTIKGVGVVAGGPYWCAEGERLDLPFGAFNAALLVPEKLIAAKTNLLGALYPCLQGPPPELSSLTGKADAKAASFEIDDLQNIKQQKIYLFHGYNDTTVARSVTDAAADFYRHYLGDANQGNLYYQSALGAGHSFVVAAESKASGLKACNANESPFIDDCGYDQAGIILRHIYGALNSPNRGSLSGSITAFDQRPYIVPDIPGAVSLGDTGYVYVPKDCENGAPCRVHVSLHGCKQDAGDIKKTYVENTGYNAWADTNRLIILYPQTQASPFLPFNPQACWDWWAYVNHTDAYVTKAGKQIRAIKAMVDALTAGAKPATTGATAGPAAAPNALAVIDTSDTSADLVWASVNGAQAYSISRAGADGAFTVVGRVAGPSFGDAGLAPKSTYRWRVSAVVNGVEGAASNEVQGVTRATPAPCDNPGSCPLQ